MIYQLKNDLSPASGKPFKHLYACFLFSVTSLGLGNCGTGLEDIFSEPAPQKVKIGHISHRYLSSSGFQNSTVSWTADSPGDFFLSVNLPCDTPRFPAGIGSRGETNGGSLNSSLFYSDFLIGKNYLYLCLKDSSGRVYYASTEIIRDDTPPTSSSAPGGGNYAILANPKLTCSDNCQKIAYTVDGSVPSFDSAGNITNGQLYSEFVLTPDASTTAIKFLAFDNAGNTELLVNTQTYLVDTTLPTLALTSVSRSYLSTTGFASTDIIWTSNRAGLTYEMRVDSSNCSDGSVIASGSILAVNTTTLSVSNLTTSGAHAVRFCTTNLLGAQASLSLTINRSDSLPGSTANIGSGSFSSPPSILLNCSPDCAGIAYTLDGTTPDFDANGNVTNGASYSGTIIPADPATTTLKFRGFSLAGNKETIPQVKNYVVDSTTPVPVVVSNQHDYISSSGLFLSTDFVWSSPRAGLSYSVRINGSSCTDGVVAGSGTAALGNNSISLGNGYFSQGNNVVKVCLANLIGIVSSAPDYLIYMDNTQPVTAINFSGGSFASPPAITLSCSSNCLSTIYTIDGSTPDYNGSGGIANGISYGGSFSVPDMAVTVVKYRSFDIYGHKETLNSRTFTVDSRTPMPGYVSNTQDYLSSIGFVSTNYTWSSPYAGAAYSIVKGGTNCSDGTVLMSGTAGASTNTTFLGNGFFSAGANSIRVCLTNLIGNSYASPDHLIYRDDTPPVTSADIPGGAYGTSQLITLSCVNNCWSIAYTLDGTTPNYNSSGAISIGTAYAAPIVIPAATTTTLKYRAFNQYGIREGVQTQVYVIP